MRFAGTPDPRRRPSPAPVDASPLLVNRAALGPGLVQSEHVAGQGIELASVVFDRASFAYDLATHGNYSVNGNGTWTRVGLDPNDVRAYIGPTDEPLYVWVWASFGWSNSASGDHAHATAALYDGINPLARERAVNPISDWLPADGNYHRFDYHGFFAVPVVDGAEWSVGMQHAFLGTKKTGQKINRQSVIAFVSAAPADADTNTTGTVDGDEA